MHEKNSSILFKFLKKLLPICSWFENTSTGLQQYDIKYMSDRVIIASGPSRCARAQCFDVVPSL
jgi:hypothetical protein